MTTTTRNTRTAYDHAGMTVADAVEELTVAWTLGELHAALDEHRSTGDSAALGMLRLAIEAKS